MINVIATVTAKAGQRAEVLRLFLENVPKVLDEDGCIEYGAVIDVENGPGFQAKIGPDTFYVIEKWRDLEALNAHAKAPHMATYGAASKDLVATRAIHILEAPETACP